MVQMYIGSGMTWPSVVSRESSSGGNKRLATAPSSSAGVDAAWDEVATGAELLELATLQSICDISKLLGFL